MNRFSKLLLVIVIAVMVFAVGAHAELFLPRDANGVPLQDFRYNGASFAVVTSSLVYTEVDAGAGVLHAIYAVCAATSTTDTIFAVETDTTSVLFTSGVTVGLDVPAAASASYSYVSSGKIRLIEPTGGIPLRYTGGIAFRPNSNNTDVLVIYTSTD